MPMPPRATAEKTSSPAVLLISARTSMPAPASSMAIRAVRSRPMRRTSAGVSRPETANMAVGIMPKTPTTAVE
ncbi:Uncharacterised protein [Mycobacteroides abscessus subsp. abscessus]|nr:Uncharacterised protein [Mycobacteroides abscessus subsp. abscessus]